MRRFFEHSKHMFKLMDKKIITTLRSKISLSGPMELISWLICPEKETFWSKIVGILFIYVIGALTKNVTLRRFFWVLGPGIFWLTGMMGWDPGVFGLSLTWGTILEQDNLFWLFDTCLTHWQGNLIIDCDVKHQRKQNWTDFFSLSPCILFNSSVGRCLAWASREVTR